MSESSLYELHSQWCRGIGSNFMIATYTPKHHRDKAEVKKEKIAVNAFLSAFPYRPGRVIPAISLHVLDTSLVDKGCKVKVSFLGG